MNDPTLPVADQPPQLALRRRLIQFGVGLAVLLVLYALAGFLLAPWLVQRQLPQFAAERLGVELTLGSLRFNPFSLRAESRDITVSLPDGDRLATAERISANLAWSGLFTRQWTLSSVELDRPRVELTREADGSFALPQPRQDETPPPATDGDGAPDEGAPPAVLLRRLTLNDGRFTVRSRDDEYAPVVADGITLEANDVATGGGKPSGRYRFASSLPGGGKLTAEGLLAVAARSSAGSFSVADAELSGWWPLAARDWKLAPPGGRLSGTGNYRAGVTADGFDLVLDRLSLDATGLHLAQPDAETPMLALQHATTSEARFALGERQLTLPGLHLTQGELSLQVDAEGRLEWATLRRNPDETPDTETAPWHIELPDARVEALALHYRELSNERRRLDVARTDATGSVLITTGGEGVRVDSLAATLLEPRFSGGDATPLKVQRIAIDNGSVDTARRSLRAAGLRLSGSQVEVAITPDGSLQVPGGLLPRAAQEGRPADAPADEPTEPWSYDFQQVSADDIELGFHDRRAATPLQLQATGTLQLSKVASGADTPLGLEAQLELASGGVLRLQGEAAQDAGTLKGQLQLDGVDLTPARALVEYHTTLRLVGGRLGSELQLAYARDAQPKLKVDGNARLDRIRFDVAESGEALFSARSVTTSGALQLSPNRMTLSSVVLDQPTAVLQVDADRQLNLAEVVRERQQEDAPREDDGERFPLNIERVELSKATIDFSDESLILPFSTQITELNGTLRSVSNAPDSEAVLDARGAIKPHGEARAEGRLRPFAPTELTDVTVKFDNVEMSELSPYTATFAGRTIARGRLWLEVDYRVFDQRLDGLNAVTLEDFELGERVDSPSSMDLPLELALALLRDPEGRVHLEVPVRGDVDDASFGYGALVRDAIGNVLQRAITAPFRLLARLVGGGDEDDSLEAIGFEPGSDRLAPPQQENLQRLAEALDQRPRLRLQLRGTYLSEVDDKALRTQALRREIADSAGTTPDEGPVPQLDFGNEAVRIAVANRYEELTGPNALAEFRSEFAQGPEAGNEAALHRALFERLLQNQPLAESALEDLAHQRSEAVQAFLVDLGVAQQRLDSQPAGSASSDKGAGVELSVATD